MSAALERWPTIRVRHQHRHPPIRNVNEIHETQMTFGARAADAFANAVGSWAFIVTQSVMLVIWITLNVIAWIRHWDPYPFILLNLALSFQAANFSAPSLAANSADREVTNRIFAASRTSANGSVRAAT